MKRTTLWSCGVIIVGGLILWWEQGNLNFKLFDVFVLCLLAFICEWAAKHSNFNDNSKN